jgi:hypothetical protein
MWSVIKGKIVFDLPVINQLLISVAPVWKRNCETRSTRGIRISDLWSTGNLRQFVSLQFLDHIDGR